MRLLVGLPNAKRPKLALNDCVCRRRVDVKRERLRHQQGWQAWLSDMVVQVRHSTCEVAKLQTLEIMNIATANSTRAISAQGDKRHLKETRLARPMRTLRLVHDEVNAEAAIVLLEPAIDLIALKI